VSQRVVSPRLAAYVVVAAGLLAAGLASGRGGLVALGAPFGLAAVLAAGSHPAAASARTESSPLVADAGAQLDVVAHLEGRPGQVVELALVIPVGVAAPTGNTHRLRLDGAGRADVALQLRAARRGAYALGTGVVRVTDPLGLIAVDTTVAAPAVARVRPRPEPLRTMVEARRLPASSGSHTARTVGPGLELAGLRPYQPGDRSRDLSWRASARRDDLMVVQRHPDRGADVIVFVDCFEREGLEDTIRASLSVVTFQLAQRDRVGLILFGGALRTLRPGSGRRQYEAIAEALVDAQPIFSWAEKEVRAIPPRSLPRAATILAVSPLIDERAIGAIGDLRRRRHEIGVIEVTPTSWAPPPADRADELARRLWEMEREARRARLAAAGVPVAEWHPGVALELVMHRLAVAGRGRRPGMAS
jgi:uncharacterized protein (DUF58 family)